MVTCQACINRANPPPPRRHSFTVRGEAPRPKHQTPAQSLPNMDTHMMDIDGDIVLDVEPGMEVQDSQQPQETPAMGTGEVRSCVSCLMRVDLTSTCS